MNSLTTVLPDHPFTARDLADLGLERQQLRRLLADGVVRKILYGVYCRTDLEDTVQLRASAAALVLPGHAVICDRSAAWLWGVSCFDYAEIEILPRLEVVSVGGKDRSRRGGLYGGKRALLEDEICEIGGVRVTSPVRTAIDLACLRGRRDALAVLDAFRRQFGISCEDYDRQLRRFRGRRGCKQARELAPLSIADAESQGESWTRMTIIDDGLAPPRAQVEVRVPGYGWVRLDLAYEHLRIAIEYDGEEFHSSEEDRAADERRRSALRAAGWIVIVVTKSDFASPRVDEWLAELRQAIAERVPAYRRVYSRGESWDPRAR
jgi:very-short-patch-repair endonuclease